MERLLLKLVCFQLTMIEAYKKVWLELVKQVRNERQNWYVFVNSTRYTVAFN